MKTTFIANHRISVVLVAGFEPVHGNPGLSFHGKPGLMEPAFIATDSFSV